MLWVTSAQAVAPVAVLDTFSTGSGVALNDDLSLNDSGLDGPSDTYSASTLPLNGTLLVNADGTFTYTPNAGYAGDDTFTYTINDGAGGTSSASATVSVASATDFLGVANPLLITPEDTSIPLGLSVSLDLFNGGALQDIVSTDVLFRPASAGLTPLTATIPAGVTGVTITGYSTQFLDTAGNDDVDDDYQLLNVRIDLIANNSSGRLANLVGGNLTNLDQYSWSAVPLGQAVLSDPTRVLGFSTGGASDPVFSVVGSQLSIVENHSLETAYLLEYTTASGDSTNFLGASSSVQVNGTTQSTIQIPAGVEPPTGRQGIVVLSANNASAGNNSRVEHKGFNRLVIDFDSQTISGAIAALRGETEANTVTYAFKDYPLVDLRNGPAVVSDVISASGVVIGDVTGNSTVLDNPTVYVNAAGEIVIERTTDFANTFTSLYTGEAYERTGFGSIASFVDVTTDDTLFNMIGGVAPDGGPANELQFNVPASAQVGLVQMSWSTVGGTSDNENVGFGFAVVDVNNETTSGSITFIRNRSPDLVSWDSVPFNTTMFGATDASGNPLFQSNKVAGTFTDTFGQTARFNLVNLADGSKTLVFTAENTSGPQAFRQYQGNMQISWLGSEPFEIQGVPVTGLLSHGSPTAGGDWEIDFSELPLLSYIPQDHSSDVVDLDFTLSSSGETESIRIYIEPVVDPITLTANDSAGFINMPVPLSISTSASVDVDGSENEPDSLRLQGVPPSVVLSSGAGTVTNVSSGVWDVSDAALASLQALSLTPVSATVFVFGEQTDENDLDASGVIDDGGNSVGADEFDVVNFTKKYLLEIFDIPTVVPQVTSLASPVITGDVVLAAGESFTVTVNGVSYTNGDGNLVVNANGTWTLTIPASDALAEGTYSVEAERELANGAAAPDITASELLIDLTPPPAPGVTSQTTQDQTPLISGTTVFGTGDVLTVEVNGVVYTEGDGNLVNNGDGTWDLTIPAADILADALYQVVARLTDVAGNSTTDPGVDDLVVDTTAPPSPGVTSLVTNDDTPTIFGTAIVGVGETLTVEVNGVVYTAGNGDLVDNGDGTWELTIPPTNVLPEANYDVTATVTDAAGNLTTDPSSSELTVDLTLPATPVIFSQATNNPTPVISGLATVQPGEVFTVEVNGIVYTAGDGSLVDNGDGTWDLTIPPANALVDNIYNVTATVTDIAGNSTSDGTVSELIVDLTATVAPTVILTADLNNDALLNVAEAVNPQPVDILLPVGAVAGDTLLWTDTVSPANTVLTAADIAAGVVSTTVALPADGTVLTVSSLLIDQVGNTSPSGSDAATVDITTPAAPTIIIAEDVDDNSFLNIAESSGPVDVSIQLPAGIVAGDLLTIILDGVTSTVLLSAADISAGFVNVTTPTPANGSTIQAQAFITDPAGNSTPTVNDTTVLDLSAPFIPTANNLITNNATPTLTGNAAVGPSDILTVTVNGVTYTNGDGFLTYNGAGLWSLAIPASDAIADGTYDVAVSLTDPAGNASVDVTLDELVVDTVAPAVPSVTSLITNIQVPTVSGTATVGASDILRVEINGITYAAGDGNLVDNGDGTWDLTIPVSDTLPEANYNVTATVTDTAGNIGTDPTSAELTIDLTATVAPTVVLTADVNNDALLNSAEAQNPQPVDILLPAGAAVGDTLLWTDSVSPANTVLTAADIAAGVVSTTVALPADGSVLTVTSVLIDLAGNTSPGGSDSATVDLTPSDPPIVVIVADADDNSLLNNAEAVIPQPIDITLPATAAVGFTLAVNDGTSVTNIVLTAADIAAGVVSTTAILPADGSVLNVFANLEDLAGNVSTNGTDFALLDLTLPDQPTIVINEDANNDGFINIAENVGLVDVQVSLPATASVGDVLTTSIRGVIANKILSAADITAGVINLTTTAPAQGAFVIAEAFLTDPAGNVSITADDTAQLDISPPFVPTVNSQITNIGTPVITGTAAVGPNDTLRVTVNGVTYLAGDGNLIDNGNGTWSLTIPPADALVSATYDVTVQLEDPAGNTTSDGTVDELIVDLVPPAIPTVNNLLTNIVVPTLTGTAIVGAGESLSVTVNGVTYTEGDGNLSLAANGDWTLSIPTADALTDGTYEVIAEVIDAAGNVALDVTANELVVDLTPPPAPGVTSQSTQDTTPLISGTTPMGAGYSLTVLVNGVLYTEGDGNLVVNANGTWDLTLPAADLLADGLYQVVATVTDAAGNTATDPGVDDLVVDTVAPPTPGVTSLTTNIQVPTISGTAIVGVGETLTVEVNGITYTAGDGNLIDNGDGTWELTIPAIDALPEANYNVTAMVTDIAGNTSIDPSSAELTIDLTAPSVPTVDPQISNSATPVVTGTATLLPGELLTVTINGVSYTAGDGNLSDNGDGTWSLAIPAADALAEAIYDVAVMIVDLAGNGISDGTLDELEIDLTATVAPTVILTADVNNDVLLNIAEAQNPQPVDILLPVGAVVGDTLLWTDTVAPANTILTAADIAAGVVSSTVALPVNNSILTVTAVLIDQAGNASPSDNDSATVDISAPLIPTVNALLTNNVTPAITGNAAVGPGDVLTVTVNGVTYVEGDGFLTYNGAGAWVLAIPASDALADATYDVAVSVTDPAGNTSVDVTLGELEVDLIATVAPTVILTADVNNDALLNTVEAQNPQPVDILLPAGAAVGDTLLWTDTVTPANTVLTAANIAAGVVSTTVALPADGSVLTVSAVLTDQAGNASPSDNDSALVDITVSAAPIIVIAEDADDNNFVNIAESSGAVDVTIQLPTGAAAGDLLTVTLDGVVSTILLSATDIAAGAVSVTTPTPANGSTIQVSAFITDPSGNSTPTVTDSAVLDVSAPFIPTAHFQITSDATPTLTGNAAVGPGDVLAVTVNGVSHIIGDGFLTYNGAGAWALAIPTIDSLPDATYDVAVSLTDLAGNTSVDITVDELLVDTLVPALPSVTSLITNTQEPIISGTATVGASETLTVLVNGITYIAGDGNLVDNGDGTWNLTIPALNALPEATYNVTATVTDTAGNSSTDASSSELTIDLTPTIAPTVILTEDLNNDALLSAAEAQNPQPVDILLPAGAVVGDTLLWTDTVAPANTVLSAADIAAGVVSTTVALPADGSVLTVTSLLIDLAGNASANSVDSATVDITTPLVPSIVIAEDTDDNSFLNIAESNGPVDVTILLPVGVVAGDTLTVILDGVVTAIVLSATDVAAGVVNVTTPAPTNGSTILAEAFITDLAGNTTATVNDSTVLDLSAPFIPTVNTLVTNNASPTLTGNAAVGSGDLLMVTVNGITYVDGDGFLTYNGAGAWALAIPASDALADATYDVAVNLTDPAGNTSVDITLGELVIDTVAPQAPGITSQTTPDTTPVISGTTPISSGLTLSVLVNGVTYTQGDGNLVVNPDGTWILTIPPADVLVDGLYQVVATVIDLAGNSSIDSGIDDLVIDSVLPTTPGVTSQVTNTTVPVIAGTATVGLGETLTVNVNGITYTAGDGNLFDNGNGTWLLNLPAANALPEAIYSVTATVIDLAGNTSADPSSNELTIDLTAPDVPTVNPQLSNVPTPTVVGTVVLLPGETLTVTINGVVYTAGDGNLVDNGDGTWQLDIPAADALAEGTYDVSVNVVDQAGNSTQDVSLNELEVDLTATIAPIPILTADTNNDAFLNASEASASQPVTILLPAGAVVGDNLLWSDGVTPANRVLSAVDIAAGFIQTAVNLPADGSVLTVSTVLVDLSGNASPSGTDSATVDSTVPSAPVIVISEDTDDDMFLNLSEIVGPVDVNITLPAGAILGDILVITLDGVVTSMILTAADIASGVISLTTPALGQGSNLIAEAFIVDLAGNASTVVDDVALVDTSAPFIPSVNSFITNDVTPVITGNAAVGPGDILQVTVNGITYTAGALGSNGALINNSDGTWSLTLPAADALSDGIYDVAVSLTDPAGNASTDITLGELVIDTVAPQAPAVTSQTTSDQTPLVSGTYTPEPGVVLSLTVNGINYPQGGGPLTANPDGTWNLQIPSSDFLADNLYQVTATATDLAGNFATDLMVDDLLVDTALPTSPGVTSLITNSGTPVIQGAVSLAPGETFSVVVNGVLYVPGDGNLVLNADGTWALTIPPSDELDEGVYDVVAMVTDAAGNTSVDPSSAELVIDFTVPTTPTVTAQPSNSGTPIISGTVQLLPGEVFTVTVNGITYTPGDGSLVVNPDGTWQLSIPAADALPEGVYNVIVTVTDLAGNVTTDSTAGELIIDLTPPPMPTFTNVLSGSTTPTIGGQVQLAPGDVFTVTVNGVTYTVGDGFLSIDASGNWTLMIDPSQPLVDGVYDVTLSIEDAAGNVVSNVSGQQITIDTGAPSLTVDPIGIVATFRPAITGTTDAVDGSVVTIRDADGNIICDAIVTGGVWTCTPVGDLVEGVNDFIAEITDPAGNVRIVNFSITVSADFDGDGISNSVEGFGDTDGDGVPDSIDLDADNDGIPDANESTLDSDGDGLPNYLDGDADNDGVADILEALGFDDDRNFTVDNFVDADGNGLSDDLQAIPLTLVDTDFDGVPDYLDVDSDNDGVPDIQENLGEDLNNNGRIDNFIDADADGVDDGIQAFPLVILDTDNDGAPNYLDLDSDNDGLSDVQESVGTDFNEDSIVDPMTDADQDSIPDSVDFSVIGGLDADDDGIEDSADADFVLGDDMDGDGIVDEFDPDANGDGFFDASGDIADLPDSDNNDIPDLQEAFGELRTGRRGVGGCSINAGGLSNRDPLLMLLALFAFAGILRYRKKSSNASNASMHQVARTKRTPWLMCVLLCGASLFHTDAVFAEDSSNFHKRFYLGLGAGLSYLDPDESDIPFKLEDETDFAWGGFVGYDISPRISVELGFNDLGQAELEQDHFVTYEQTSISALLYGLNGKKSLQCRTGFSAFARVGVSRMENDSDIGFIRDNDISVLVGAGVELGLENGLAVRGELTSYDIDSNYAGVSLIYRFGHPTHKQHSAVLRTPEPEPVVESFKPVPIVKPLKPAPVAEPEVIRPTPGPVVVLPTEFAVLFDTNSSGLDETAARVVDNIQLYLLFNMSHKIDVTGYADMRGPLVVNERLSEERAKAVAISLVRRGIAEDRIAVEVGGATDKFGDINTISGMRENRRAHVTKRKP